MESNYMTLAQAFDEYRETHEPREYAVAAAESQDFALTVYILFTSARYECFVFSVVAQSRISAQQITYGAESLADAIRVTSHAVGAYMPEHAVEAVVEQAKRGMPWQLMPITF